MDIELCNDKLNVEATLEEVSNNIYKKNYEKAKILIEELVNKVESSPSFENDTQSDHYTFNEAMEEILFRHIYKPEIEVRHASIPYSFIYLQYGSLLLELGKVKEAREALEKAIRWNPINVEIAFEYIETYKVTGDFEKFAELTRKAFKHAFRRKDIARCYRNMGYYFIEKELYKVAVSCYLLSMNYDKDSRNVQGELDFIEHKAGRKIEEPTREEIEEYSKQYKFPLGANEYVISIAYNYGKKYAEAGQEVPAKYFMSIIYELTQDENIKKIIDSIN
mgnify:CR=1 FL=1